MSSDLSAKALASAEALAKEDKIMFYVYILESNKDKSHYTGITENLLKRLKIHNYGGSKFTERKKPYKLIYYSVFNDKDKAFKFEKYLKSGSEIAFSKKHLF